MSDERDEILRSLLTEQTVDIITTGRKTGQARTTEIWTTCLFGSVFICGTPNRGQPGIDKAPRDWMANLLADPEVTLRLKTSVRADMAARATPVTDPGQRRRILSEPSTAYYSENAISFESALANSPMVELTFEGEASWLNEAVRSAAG